MTASLALLPWQAEAASLGRLTVFSGLGQSLRAELDISATREELAAMSARLAASEVFSQSGVDYVPALRNLRFAIDKRPDGRPVVRVTSSAPINEPFLDFLVELNWPAGRLVREYTFLLDPPELVSKGAPGTIADSKSVAVETVAEKPVERTPPKRTESRAIADVPAPQPAPAPERIERSERADSFAESDSAPSRRSSKPARIKNEAPAPEAPPANGEQIRVKSGDTLQKIAAANRYEAVSLEQMLVALYRNNPSAFMGNNINRLRSGAILGLPEKSEVEAIPETEAKKVFQAQAADWHAYRRKLAAATAGVTAEEAPGAQSASGKISAKLEEKVAPAEQAKDQLKVSRTEVAKPGGKPDAALEADRIASEKALKEAQERVAQLEKNVGDLQKLLELKNEKLAELERVKTAEVKSDDAKPAEAAKAPEQAKPEVAAPPVEAAKPAEPEKPAVAAQPAPPPAKPVPKKSAEESEEEPEEPGFFDGMLQNPLLLGVGGLLATALMAAGLLRRRRAQQDANTLGAATSTLASNSEFRSTGGQSVDTGSTPASAEFSQAGPGTIDTDDVDPVAEADVYMAYGRDNQAEEILLEALQRDPQRTAIHIKLLEIYAGRQRLKPFENVAGELFALTGGLGSDWAKAAELGAALDPANPLYKKQHQAAPAPLAEPAVIEVPAEPLAAEPVQEAAQDDEAPPAHLIDTDTLGQQHVESVSSGDDLQSIDFEVPAAPVATELPPLEAGADENDPVEEAPADALDFDMTPVVEPVAPTAAPESESELASASDALPDFEFELPPVEPEEVAAPVEEIDLPPVDLPEALVSNAPLALADEDEASALEAVAAQELAAKLAAAQAEAPSLEEAMPDDVPEIDVASAIDFDLDLAKGDLDSVPPLDLPAPAAEAPAEEPVVAAVPEAAVGAELASDPLKDLEFEVNLSDSVVLGEPDKQAIELADIDLDLNNLDLPAPLDAVAEPAADIPPAPETPDAHWEEVNTKLDLAKAYEEMGDLEGARELLKEVAVEGTPDLAMQARTILERIGG